MVPAIAFDGKVAWSVSYMKLGVGATRFGDFRSTYRSATAWTKNPAGCRIEQAPNEWNELREPGSAESLRSPLLGRGVRG
jgi:hypothetical protein